MSQPKWRAVDNLGDTEPLTNGGLFVYEDETGVYPPEMEALIAPHEASWDLYNPALRWSTGRVVLDGFRMFQLGDDKVCMVPEEYTPDWPHPAEDYRPWFADELQDVANYADCSVDALRTNLCANRDTHPDWMRRRADAYRAIASLFGYEMLGDVRFGLTRTQAERVIPPDYR